MEWSRFRRNKNGPRVSKQQGPSKQIALQNHLGGPHANMRLNLSVPAVLGSGTNV